MDDLPPLNYVRSFEASARRLSFTDAAAELNMTQAAVSGHIRALEQFIGGPLFHRHPRSISLTSLGKAYLPEVRLALETVNNATAAVSKRGGKDRVVVSCPMSLTSGWLVDALVAFQAVQPGVPVTIYGAVWADEPPEVADIILTYAHEDDLHRDTTVLWRDRLTVVCAPGFQVGGADLTRPDQLALAPLVHNLGRPGYWQKAFERLGVAGVPNLTYQTNNFTSAAAMATSGLGVAILYARQVREALANGDLVAPFGDIGVSPWVLTISDDSLLRSHDGQALHRFLTETS